MVSLGWIRVILERLGPFLGEIWIIWGWIRVISREIMSVLGEIRRILGEIRRD